MKIQMTHEIPDGLVEGLIWSAIEGRVTRAWCSVERCVSATSLFGQRITCVAVDEEEKKRLTLTRAAVKRGLRLMASKYPRHWADFATGRGDALTGDVFIQLALLGELRYG